MKASPRFPHDPPLAERGLRDGVGGLYVECARRGELLTLGQRSVDIATLLRAALDRFGRPARVVADRWREAELRDALETAGVPPAAFEARGMGYRDGAEDVRAFRRACADGKVTSSPSLLLRSAMAEARTLSDPAGNAKLSKGSQGGRRLRARDDAAAASILAVAAGVRQPAQPPRRWRYHRPRLILSQGWGAKMAPLFIGDYIRKSQIPRRPFAILKTTASDLVPGRRFH